jgi:RNase adaptor protein for sRNA GlmZ degradation
MKKVVQLTTMVDREINQIKKRGIAVNKIAKKQLSKKLYNTYNKSPRKEQVIMVMLFGMKYNKQLSKLGVIDVVNMSGLPKGYVSELYRGIKLSKHLKVKPSIGKSM